MALTRCKDCGKDVSDIAKQCMNCGRPPPRAIFLPAMMFFALPVLFVVFYVLFYRFRS